MKTLRNSMARLCAAFLFAATLFAFTGCEREDKVLNVETPDGEVEVEKDPDTGDINVEVNTDDDPNQNNP